MDRIDVSGHKAKCEGMTLFHMFQELSHLNQPKKIKDLLVGSHATLNCKGQFEELPLSGLNSHVLVFNPMCY